jgi:IS66 Orf2 like protein.
MEIALRSEQIYIANKPIDFRKGIDGLCALVVEELQRKPGEGIYIFYNRRIDKVKVLGWHRNGFILLSKRLESGKFFVSSDSEQINSEQLNMLLIGINWKLLTHSECKINTYF